MKATYKRSLVAAFATVGLMNLGMCQPDQTVYDLTQQSVTAQAQTPIEQGSVNAADSVQQQTIQNTPAIQVSGANTDNASTIPVTLDTSNVPQIAINDMTVNFTDAQPGMLNGKLMVPVRAVCEQLGATVDWLDQQKQVVINLPSQDTVTLNTNQDWLAMQTDQDQQAEQMNDEQGGPNVPTAAIGDDQIVLIGDHAYMPFDELAVAMKGTGNWDGSSSTTASITVDQTGNSTPMNDGTTSPDSAPYNTAPQDNGTLPFHSPSPDDSDD